MGTDELFWAMLHIFSKLTGSNCDIIFASHLSLSRDREGVDILRHRCEILRFLFTKISKLIKFSRGRSSVYSAKFRRNDRLISYEKDQNTSEEM